jgi:dephospho-CoA kinase
MIIGLTGYAQSGKDTVANILVEKYGYERLAFADPIRDILYDLNPMVDSIAGRPVLLQELVDKLGWDKAKLDPRVRQYLQNLGVGARNHLGEDVWVINALRKMSQENIVITDVRFENEAEVIHMLEGQVWRIKRPGVEAVNEHISESQMDGYKVDQIFVNSGTIEDLEMTISVRMQSVSA